MFYNDHSDSICLEGYNLRSTHTPSPVGWSGAIELVINVPGGGAFP